MGRNLPPLAALCAFEAAARHPRFTAAAKELGLTASAVSHQIKRLEEHLGGSLFDRGGDMVRLTPLGRRYLLPVRAALDAIALASGEVRREVAGGRVLLTAPAAFVEGWLAAQRPALESELPQVVLAVVPKAAPGERADLEVRLGPGDWDRLCSAELQPLAGGRGYYLVWHRGGRDSAAAMALREWLLARAAAGPAAGSAAGSLAGPISETRSLPRHCARHPAPRSTAPSSL